MGKIRKNKKKAWHDKRSKKLQTKWYGKEERIRSFSKSNESDIEEIHYNKDHQFVAKTPEYFSLIDNTEETIRYFNTIIYVIEKKKFKQGFYLDSSKVRRVTTEALIYMIAVIYNIKANKALQYTFEGNLPISKSAQDVFKKSGYLNYFKMKRLKMPDSSECVEIVSGKNVETDTARKICDFVIDKLGVSRRHTKVLYATLIELMSNTARHAYQDKHKMMENCWYLYAIYDGDKIKFSFVDTGEGIPSTIKKKLTEKLNFSIDDSRFLELSLTESGRSETGLANRGRGLPNLYDHVKDGSISDFYVLSGTGSCIYNKSEHNLLLTEYTHRIFGTIFSFSIKKENVLCAK